ncbi:MAG: SDR family oxidoreductase [Armatimonadetes bacterium]|nr:SDR family oxidoreductase [Armatimonadota bacterium]
MGLLDGKVALVTGGSGNIGTGVALALARVGADVAVQYLTNAERANKVAFEIEALGKTASVWQCDVRDVDAVKAMIDGIAEKHGRIDAIVNNANDRTHQTEGWYIDDISWEDVAQSTDVMAKGLWNTTLAILPHFKEQRSGRIVNIISEHWHEAYSGEIRSMAAEGAVMALSRRFIYWDLGSDNITLNMITAGWTRSSETNGADVSDNPYVKLTPLKRIAEPEDIGNACALLISDLASFISGANIPVTGGRNPIGCHDSRDSVRANTSENGGRHPQARL